MCSSKNAKHHWFNGLKSTAEAWLDPGLRGLDEQFFDVLLLLYLLLCILGQAIPKIGRQSEPDLARGFFIDMSSAPCITMSLSDKSMAMQRMAYLAEHPSPR